MAAGRREKGWRKETHDSTDLERVHIFLHYVTILNVNLRTGYSHFYMTLLLLTQNKAANNKERITKKNKEITSLLY